MSSPKGDIYTAPLPPGPTDHLEREGKEVQKAEVAYGTRKHYLKDRAGQLHINSQNTQNLGKVNIDQILDAGKTFMHIKHKDKAKEKSTNLGGQGNRDDSEKRQRRCVELPRREKLERIGMRNH